MRRILNLAASCLLGALALAIPASVASAEPLSESVTAPAAAALHARVLSGPTTADRGQPLTYTFSVANAGGSGSPTTTAAVIATTPAGSLTDVSWTCASTTGTCAAPSGTGLPDTTIALPAGASATYAITAQASDTSDGVQLRLQADPTGGGAQASQANAAVARTDLPPILASGSAPAMALTSTTGYSGRATATRASYLGGNIRVTDTWQRCAPDGSSCADIPGAVGLGYTTGSATRGYTLRLHERASNAAGTLDTYTAPYSPLPSTELATSTRTDTNQTSAAFTLTSDTSGAVFECQLDGGPWQPCSASPTYSNLSDGAHTLQVRAVYAGLSAAVGAGFTWTVDTNVPSVAITSAPAGETNQTTASIAFSSTKSGTSFRCSLDGADWTPCGSPWSAPALTQGQHTFEVEALDAAGNISSPAAASWTVIPPPPLASPLTTADVGSAAQTVQLAVPAGGSVTLLEPDGTPVDAVIVAWQGRYVLNPVSGELSFIPVPSFSGHATPVAYRVTDAYGQSAQSTYAATVNPDTTLPLSRSPRVSRAVARCAALPHRRRRRRHHHRARSSRHRTAAC